MGWAYAMPQKMQFGKLNYKLVIRLAFCSEWAESSGNERCSYVSVNVPSQPQYYHCRRILWCGDGAVKKPLDMTIPRKLLLIPPVIPSLPGY